MDIVNALLGALFAFLGLIIVWRLAVKPLIKIFFGILLIAIGLRFLSPGPW
ncbi:MAG: hypothetical protein RDV00_05275 [Clostridia bacterium]|jgi:sulfite exporter TauE/SafE|nr:hypothetical protein [Clostridia bacterium]MDQ7791520.1 hypothetical protein [Clostridia bacterium]